MRGLRILLNSTLRHHSSFHHHSKPNLRHFLCKMEPSTSDSNLPTKTEHTRTKEELLRYVQDEFRSFANEDNFNRIAAKLVAIEAEKSRLICELKVANEHVNTKGGLHGGQAASLVDIVTARAVGLTVRDKGMASIEISLSYLSPVQLGEEIIIEANVLKCGRNIAFTDCEFRRKSDGRLCVKGKHTIAILPGQPPIINGKAQLY